jgi:alanine-glyoxylate transaminase/serine-glyoxylate transaminase/serine-pyruvate transaminase
MGLKFVMPEAQRLPQLTLVSIYYGFRNQLLQQYNLEIGTGLGTLAAKHQAH